MDDTDKSRIAALEHRVADLERVVYLTIGKMDEDGYLIDSDPATGRTVKKA